MHKDFHLYGTYLAARLAGHKMADAQKIAFAAQAVDDYTYGDYASCQEISQMTKTESDVLKTYWSTFHFLPGGILDDGIAGEEEKYATKPSGFLYDNLHNDLLKEPSKNPLWLAKAGVTMHVLADTYAHEGFSGIPSDLNTVTGLTMTGGMNLGVVSKETRHVPATLLSIGSTVLNWIDVKSKMLEAAKIGHGTASHAPDLSWVNYAYTRNRTRVERSNPIVFASAFVDMYKLLGGAAENSEKIFAIVKSAIDSLRERKIELGGSSAEYYSEESDDPFASILLPSRFFGLKSDMDGIFERSLLKAGYAPYIKEVNDLSKAFCEANDKAQQEQKFKSLIENNFYSATIWHRQNVVLAMLGLFE